MKKQYFGTDGIRGEVGQFPIVPEFMTRLGYAAGKVLARDAKPSERCKILIGKDTRVSGYLLEAALEAGFAAAGAPGSVTLRRLSAVGFVDLLCCRSLLPRACGRQNPVPCVLAIAGGWFCPGVRCGWLSRRGLATVPAAVDGLGADRASGRRVCGGPAMGVG